jgi:hypothetical protein
LLAGSFLMGTYMFIIAVLTQRYPPVSGGTLTPPAIASLTMIYLEASEWILIIKNTSSHNMISSRLLTFICDAYSDVQHLMGAYTLGTFHILTSHHTIY